LGLKHVFGVPGDYVLGFYDMLVASNLKVVGTCTEAGAGFAADAYARVNGLGCVCITYCVGGLNALNSVAGAYAEKSPLVVISGAPGMAERSRSALLHHKVREFTTQLEIFEKVTVASVAVEEAAAAPRLIDETLEACLRYMRPVYIELPRDLVDKRCPAPRPWKARRLVSDQDALKEAVNEAAAMLRAAKRPAILAGVEIHRYSLQDALIKLVERSGFPVAATLLGKSVMTEAHPQYIGIYEGAMGREDVCKRIESADAVLILGAMMTDIDLGVFTAKLDPKRTINADSERITIKHHSYDDVKLKHFIEGLAEADIGPDRGFVVKRKRLPEYTASPGAAITVRRLFARMNHFLDERSVVICDIGDSLFGAADLTIHRRTEFLSPAYYTSMGFAVPAAIGAQANQPRRRPIVFVGDGAFQMTGMELSTIVKEGLNPIVIVLNNKGYSTERFINDGPYNDIQDWAFHKLPDVLGAGKGYEVRTEGDLETVLASVEKDKKEFSIVNVHLDPYDRSTAMERLGKRLGERVR
jgi:indolepyruvate decarboxylase